MDEAHPLREPLEDIVTDYKYILTYVLVTNLNQSGRRKHGEGNPKSS